MKFIIGSFLLLTLLLLAGAAAPATSSPTMNISSMSNPSPGLGMPHSIMEPLTAPGPDLAVSNWTSNYILNPGFEAWNSPESPVAWGGDAPGDICEWFATQPPWQVHQGIYSAGLQCHAPNHHIADAYWAQYGVETSAANLTLRFDWYLDRNSDPINDAFYFTAAFYDDTYWHYIRYYLNGTPSAINSTYWGYYLLHEPSHEWNTFSRNLTADFLAIPDFPKTIAPSFRLMNPQFHLWASGSTTNLLRAFLDDLWLRDGTATAIGGPIRDGDFESNAWSYWSTPGNRDAADIRQSTTAHTGSWSLNLTATSAGNQSYAYSYNSVSSHPRLTTLNQGWFSLWWRLGYTKAVESSHAYVCAYFRNATTSYLGLTYYLGYGGTTTPWLNDSYNLYLHADEFNTTNTWVAFRRNLWQDAAAYFHTTELSLSMLYLQVDTRGPGSRVVLLVDDGAVISPALNDAGYEDQDLVGAAVRGWAWTDLGFTVTGTAYGGSKAANMTVAADSGFNLLQYLPSRPLNGTRETYLDVMWRLQAYTPKVNTLACLNLYLSDGNTLNYYLAVSSPAPWHNDTYNAWFNATGVGSTGAWVPMHRDLAHDYQAVFGTLPNTTIQSITLGAETLGGSRLVLLLDDLYLYDDPAPRVTGVGWNPIAPDHNQPVQVTASLVDQDLAKRLLHYRVNSGFWQSAAMNYQAGTTYGATIPGQAHGSLVEFYITANDTWGLTTTALNSGTYWSYTAWDGSAPNVNIDAPISGATLSGTVKINATASDSGTGVAVVRFRIDTGTSVNVTSAPYEYAWDTTHVSNGAHSITVTAVDYAGNWASMTIPVTVSNATIPPPIPGFSGEAILVACGAAFSLGLVRRRRRS